MPQCGQRCLQKQDINFVKKIERAKADSGIRADSIVVVAEVAAVEAAQSKSNGDSQTKQSKKSTKQRQEVLGASILKLLKSCPQCQSSDVQKRRFRLPLMAHWPSDIFKFYHFKPVDRSRGLRVSERGIRALRLSENGIFSDGRFSENRIFPD